MDRFYYPGEVEAIQAVLKYGAEYGYGNLIQHLKVSWSERLQHQGISKQASDKAAGIVCVYCHVDSRTGKKIK